MRSVHQSGVQLGLRDGCPGGGGGRGGGGACGGGGAIGFVGGAVREAMEALEKDGLRTKLMLLRTIWPFPSAEVKTFAESVDEFYVVEQNATGQLASLIRREVAHFPNVHSILRFDGFGLRPRDVVEGVKQKGIVVEM